MMLNTSDGDLNSLIYGWVNLGCAISLTGQRDKLRDTCTMG